VENPSYINPEELREALDRLREQPSPAPSSPICTGDYRPIGDSVKYYGCAVCQRALNLDGLSAQNKLLVLAQAQAFGHLRLD
jgi:hypothetical protein